MQIILDGELHGHSSIVINLMYPREGAMHLSRCRDTFNIVREAKGEFHASKLQDRSRALECAVQHPSHDDLECARWVWQCSRHRRLRFAKCSCIEDRSRHRCKHD